MNGAPTAEKPPAVGPAPSGTSKQPAGEAHGAVRDGTIGDSVGASTVTASATLWVIQNAAPAGMDSSSAGCT